MIFSRKHRTADFADFGAHSIQAQQVNFIDLASYDAYLSGKLSAYELPDEEIQRALKAIEKHPACIER